MRTSRNILKKTMTPKQKAEELIMRFKNSEDEQGYNNVRDIKAAKQCALIAVDEILDQDVFDYTSDWSNTIEYWQEVKQEIERL